MSPAIFLDRDGTINKDVGFVDDLKNIMLYKYTFKSLLLLQKYFLLFIITNQSGIAKKIISETKVKVLHENLIKRFKDKGIIINEIFYCPHSSEDNCVCRKPNPYFIDKIKLKYDIDLSRSYVIGDHPSDMELSKNAGCKGAYVLSGHGHEHKDEVIKDYLVFKNLYSAAKYITNEYLSNNKRYGRK